MRIEIREELERLKWISYSKYTKEDLYLLERQWIINWVGPQSYWYFLRAVMTSFFKFLDFPRHDINFWKGWTLNDFHKANWGILKYSFLSLADEYRQICKKKRSEKIILIPLFYFSLSFKVLTILLSYNACEKYWKTAFNFNK